MGHFESVFRVLFSCGIYIANKQDSKNVFLDNFDFIWSNPYMHNSCLGISPKHFIFRNAPKPIVDQNGISFLSTNFETFTIFNAIVLIDCTYPPYYKVLFNLNFQGNEKLKLFSQETYDFQNLGNQTLLIVGHENVKKSAINYLAAKLWLKESTILRNVSTFE